MRWRFKKIITNDEISLSTNELMIGNYKKKKRPQASKTNRFRPTQTTWKSYQTRKRTNKHFDLAPKAEKIQKRSADRQQKRLRNTFPNTRRDSRRLYSPKAAFFGGKTSMNESGRAIYNPDRGRLSDRFKCMRGHGPGISVLWDPAGGNREPPIGIYAKMANFGCGGHVRCTCGGCAASALYCSLPKVRVSFTCVSSYF